MAEERVVKENLTPDRVAAGENLTTRLRSANEFSLTCYYIE
jgi:hypothetical protein